VFNKWTTKLSGRLGRRFVRLSFDQDSKSALERILVNINRVPKKVSLFNDNTIKLLYINDRETITDFKGALEVIPLHAQADSAGAQGSAQVRAATAQVQRRKWKLVMLGFLYKNGCFRLLGLVQTRILEV